MTLTPSLEEMTLSEKIGLMEEIWTHLTKTSSYAPPGWHAQIVAERRRLAEAGQAGFTDWETAKKEIRDRSP